jgi:hypothetical protein
VTWMLPATPSPVVSALTTRAGNPFLDWLHLTDSDGGLIAHYRLMLQPGTFDILHRVFYSGLADFLYSLGYLLGSSYATGLIRLVLDPNQWLNPITEFYNGITAQIYSRVPPTVIMLGTFGILLLSVFVVRSGSSAAGSPQARIAASAPPSTFSQWMPAHSKIGKAHWDRLGSGLTMMAVVLVLANNPFAIIRNVIDALLAGAGWLSMSGGASGPLHVQSAATTDMIRSITFLVNYREFLNPACAHQWSASINIGGANPHCLTATQLSATDPDLWTVALALAAVFIAWAVLSFAVIVAGEFVKHLSLTIAYFIGATWIAALTLAKRRPYDPLAEAAARGGVHFFQASVVLFVSAAGPTLFLHLVTSVLTFLPTLIQVILSAAGYYISGKVILRVIENHTSLLSLFRDKIKQSKTWTNLYPPNAPSTVASTAFGGMVSQPTSWAKDRYQQAITSSTATWSKFRGSAGTWSRTQDGSDNVATDIIADTPQFQAATTRVKLYDKPVDRVTITGADTLPAAADAGPAVIPTSVLAAPTADGTMTPAMSAPPSAMSPQEPPAGAPPYVWFRSGIPQFAPPAAQFSAPPAVTQLPAGATDIAPIAEAQPAPAGPRYFELARAQASSLYNTPTPTPTVDDVIARATQTYRGYTADTSPLPRTARRTAPPDLRSVLTAAQWTQKFNHHRNKLLARGFEAIPQLPADEEDNEHIVLVADPSGQVRLDAKNDRGFGDWI